LLHILLRLLVFLGYAQAYIYNLFKELNN
jgi:hypothetical protein